MAGIKLGLEQRDEFAAAIELRRLFPGITDNAQARKCARTIAGWMPLPAVKRMRKVPRATSGPLTRGDCRSRRNQGSLARRRPEALRSSTGSRDAGASPCQARLKNLLGATRSSVAALRPDRGTRWDDGVACGRSRNNVIVKCLHNAKLE